MANKILQGTVDYYIRGQYGILKGDDGKEYCFGRKAVGDRSKLVNGDVVKFTVDQNHPILVSKVTSYVAVKSRLIKSLAKKGYGFQIEKDGKWNILVRHGDKKMILEELGHMTILEATEWAQRAKKLITEDIDKMFVKNIKERQQIINDYNAGKFGEDEYNQKLKDVDANIKSTTANIYSSRNSILELVKSQSQAELDVLNKVIDKRKEALSAKKSYYDYDKTLKNKTKDIEVLERQIAALEGSTSAEDKARKAKLQEQLQSAKDDLNDTIVDHAYSMQTDSLDKLSTDLSEDLDTWIDKISSNMEEMTNAINGAISNAGLSTASTINAISSILRHYGLSDSEISQSGLSDIKGYASGTNYVNKSGIYRVNEKGMESVFSKQYGTLTFLNQGDKVFDANFTKSLLDNATIATQKNMPDYAGMAKAIEKNIQNIQNLSGNTYVNNFYIDGAQDTDSILKEIDKHLDKKIQAHDKKQVRDFKSLR